jgi:hypothetical protein
MLPVTLDDALRALRLLRLQRVIIRAESEGGESTEVNATVRTRSKVLNDARYK